MKQENNRVLFDAITGIDDDLIAETADTPVQNRRKPYWVAAVAALLVLAIGIGAVLGGIGVPSINTGPPQLGSPPPSESLPAPFFDTITSIRFDSIADIQNLIAATQNGQQSLAHYLSTTTFAYNGMSAPTQSDMAAFSAHIQGLLLPCRHDHASTFVCMYYYPDSCALELFYQVNGVLIQFFIHETYIWISKGNPISTTELDAVSVSLYADTLSQKAQLLSNFTVNGQAISMRADTANPVLIDLSKFYWDHVLNIPLVIPQERPPILVEKPLPTVEKPLSPDTLQLVNLVSAPHYPIMPDYPFGENQSSFDMEYTEAYWIWREFSSQWRKQHTLTPSETYNLNDFLWRSAQEFLSGEGNQVYSPLNIYMALAALAECANGNSRQEILELLGTDSIESLRVQAQKIWNAHYFSDGNTNSLLATSVWLDEPCTFNTQTIEALADNYFASVFHGDLDTEEINQQLRQWLDSQTGGLLTEQSKHSKLEEETVFALTSTLLFNARWMVAFLEKNNTIDTFHSPNGDRTVEFMHKSLSTYYWGDNFGAVELKLNDPICGSMWLILPEDGCTPQDVLQTSDWLSCVQDHSWKSQKHAPVDLSLPKFDIVAQRDLRTGLQNLGLHSIFNDESSDFTSICPDLPIYVNQIDQSLRIAIDEKGVTASAYMISQGGIGGGSQGETVNFNLDRPFIFVITGQDGLPLLTGVVNEP